MRHSGSIFSTLSLFYEVTFGQSLISNGRITHVGVVTVTVGDEIPAPNINLENKPSKKHRNSVVPLCQNKIMIGLPQVYNPNMKFIHKGKQTSDGHGETYQPYWAADDHFTPEAKHFSNRFFNRLSKCFASGVIENQINETRYAK